MKECTFKPKIITKISQNNNFCGNGRIQPLHEDHTRKTHRQPASRISHEKEEKYQPEINRISKIIVKKSFYERLEEDKEKRIEKKLSI